MLLKCFALFIKLYYCFFYDNLLHIFLKLQKKCIRFLQVFFNFSYTFICLLNLFTFYYRLTFIFKKILQYFLNFYREFYNDILPEFESCGPIRQLKVCCNHETHLRGNVYLEYFSERHALKAYQLFQGRYYAGRQISVAFTNIPSWKNALCGK